MSAIDAHHDVRIDVAQRAEDGRPARIAVFHGPLPPQGDRVNDATE